MITISFTPEEQAQMDAACICSIGGKRCDRVQLRCDSAIDAWILVMDARGLGAQARRGAAFVRSLSAEDRDAFYDDSALMTEVDVERLLGDDEGST